MLMNGQYGQANVGLFLDLFAFHGSFMLFLEKWGNGRGEPRPVLMFHITWSIYRVSQPSLCSGF